MGGWIRRIQSFLQNGEKITSQQWQAEIQSLKSDYDSIGKKQTKTATELAYSEIINDNNFPNFFSNMRHRDRLVKKGLAFFYMFDIPMKKEINIWISSISANTVENLFPSWKRKTVQPGENQEYVLGYGG